MFLDEPSTGMDPMARRFMWNVIMRIVTENKECAMILTTHRYVRENFAHQHNTVVLDVSIAVLTIIVQSTLPFTAPMYNQHGGV